LQGGRAKRRREKEKAAVTGSGRADKASVGRMVTKILGLEKRHIARVLFYESAAVAGRAKVVRLISGWLCWRVNMAFRLPEWKKGAL